MAVDVELVVEGLVEFLLGLRPVSLLPRRRASKASNLGASPAAIVCFDILFLFGDSEVTSQLDRLNSSDTYRVE